jgi:ribosome recycling factor
MLEEIQQDSYENMTKTIATLERSFRKIRAGRAHPSLLEHLQVEYYGSTVPITQTANISVEDSRTLKVTPWEKDMVPIIEKAIIQSDLGLNPQSAGMIIHIPLPPLTEERRQQLVRIVKEEAEKAKISIRNIRRSANSDFKELLKEKEISEDEAHKSETEIQKITDQHIEIINSKLNLKEKSLMDI